MNVRPPGIKENWNDCNINIQSDLIAYNQIREVEEQEFLKAFLK